MSIYDHSLPFNKLGNIDTTHFITSRQARVALDNMDDYARMTIGIDAHGPRTVLEQFIEQIERAEASCCASVVYSDDATWAPEIPSH